MQIPKEYSKIKTNLLKEVTNLQKQHQLQIISTIAALPFFNRLPGIKAIRKKLNGENIKKLIPGPKPKTGKLSLTRITTCMLPPFTFGIAGHGGNPGSHPVSIVPPNLPIEELFNPFGLANHFTGEISLSVIGGQNFNDFYGGQLDLNLTEIPIYFKNQCGLIGHLIKLPVQYDHETVVEVNVTIELPQNLSDVVELIPGSSANNNFGLVGVRGFMNIHASEGGWATSHNFLDLSKMADMPQMGMYEPNLAFTHSFNLPAGKKEFYIFINPQITAFSSILDPPVNAVQELGYALIDFRANQSHKIIRNFFSDRDHIPHGAIKIKQICVTVESYSYKLPDTR